MTFLFPYLRFQHTLKIFLFSVPLFVTAPQFSQLSHVVTLTGLSACSLIPANGGPTAIVKDKKNNQKPNDLER